MSLGKDFMSFSLMLPGFWCFPLKKKKKKQNIPSFTKWVGFNSIICKYLYIFPKNTWAELHFFLITYMPQYIILAPTSCTCKTELADEKSLQEVDNILAQCCKRNNLSGMQFRNLNKCDMKLFLVMFFQVCDSKSPFWHYTQVLQARNMLNMIHYIQR